MRNYCARIGMSAIILVHRHGKYISYSTHSVATWSNYVYTLAVTIIILVYTIPAQSSIGQNIQLSTLTVKSKRMISYCLHALPEL